MSDSVVMSLGHATARTLYYRCVNVPKLLMFTRMWRSARGVFINPQQEANTNPNKYSGTEARFPNAFVHKLCPTFVLRQRRKRLVFSILTNASTLLLLVNNEYGPRGIAPLMQTGSKHNWIKLFKTSQRSTVMPPHYHQVSRFSVLMSDLFGLRSLNADSQNWSGLVGRRRTAVAHHLHAI